MLRLDDILKKYKKSYLMVILLFAVCFFDTACLSNENVQKESETITATQRPDETQFKKNKHLWESIANKVWIKESWIGSDTYEDMSFVITKIEQGELEGKFLEKGILEPNADLYSEKESNTMVLAGNYNESGAELTLKDGNNIKGKLRISMEKDNLLSADIQYNGQKTKKSVKLKPYNLEDLETDNRAEFDNDISDINLEKWGKIKFVSVVRTSMRRRTLFLYLVDNKDNILYDFSGTQAFPNDFKVNDFSFKDINDDGRKDLLLILQGITDLKLHQIIIYEQNEMGGFEINVEKTKPKIG